MFAFSCQKSRRRALISLNLTSLNGARPLGQFRHFFTRETNPIDPNIDERLDDLRSLIYGYTSGRWLWNEKEQLAARYVKFDIEALCRVAARSVVSASCTDAVKLTEGNFNKVLLLTMSDGKEVIAKVPNPNAGPAHFTTASEVATMEFVRNVLHIPAPEVYAWCSKASETPVGAEYIIMEKVPGIKLSHVWENMHALKKSEIVTRLVQFDKSLASNPFPEYGSLYYAHNGGRNGKFTVGATTNRKYFDDGRGALALDRGPWRSIEEYVIANAQREKESIAHLGDSPRLQGLFNGPGQYRTSKTAKLRALECYMKIAHYLLPKNKTTHNPVLWHPDLHTDNIFVDPEEPTKITGVIDWQAAHIAPLFLQVRRPALLDFDGPTPERLKAPKLPENFDDLSAEEKLQAKKLHAEQWMYVLYEIELLQQCKDAGYALRGRETLVSRITGLVGSLFTDGEPIVLGYLMQAVDRWKEIVGQDAEGRALVPCPIDFTEEERSQQREDQAKWEEGVEAMDEIIRRLGAYSGWDGFVSHEYYETMKQTVVDFRKEFLQRVAATNEEREEWSKVWPFPVPS